MNPRINDCYKMLIIKVFLWINIFCCLTLNTNAENIDIEPNGRIIQKSTAEVFISEGTITIPVDLFYDNIMEVLHIPSTCTCIDYSGSEGSSLRMIFVDKIIRFMLLKMVYCYQRMNPFCSFAPFIQG